MTATETAQVARWLVLLTSLVGLWLLAGYCWQRWTGRGIPKARVRR